LIQKPAIWRVLGLLALLCGGQARAQPAPPGGGHEGMLGLALVFPSGTEEIFLVARNHQLGDAILMTDDGSINVDLPGDGEHWALLTPTPGTNLVEISGTVEGQEIWHEESIELPAAWMATTYPVTLLAIQDGGEWRFERALFGSLPTLEGATGAGMAGKAERLGLTAATLYLCWGFLILVLVGSAVVRSSVLKVRGSLG
jgi:hypothetical protein